MHGGHATSHYFQTLVKSAAATLVLFCSFASADAAVYIIWLTTAEDQSNPSAESGIPQPPAITADGEIVASSTVAGDVAGDSTVAAASEPPEVDPADFYAEIEDLWAGGIIDDSDDTTSQIGGGSAAQRDVASDEFSIDDAGGDVEAYREKTGRFARLQIAREFIYPDETGTVADVIYESGTGIARGRVCARIARESLVLGMDAVFRATDTLRDLASNISEPSDVQDDQLRSDLEAVCPRGDFGVCKPADVIYNAHEGAPWNSYANETAAIGRAEDRIEPQSNFDSEPEIISDVESYDGSNAEGDYEYGEYEYDYGYDEYGYSYESDEYGEREDLTTNEPPVDADVAGYDVPSQRQAAATEDGYEDGFAGGNDSYEEGSYGFQPQLDNPALTEEPALAEEIVNSSGEISGTGEPGTGEPGYEYGSDADYGLDADYDEYYGEEYYPEAGEDYDRGAALEAANDENAAAGGDVFAPPVVDERPVGQPFDDENFDEYDDGYQDEGAAAAAEGNRFEG
ncbi:MAG: hypothetical protein VB876_13715 [Pirellulales bacterium]